MEETPFSEILNTDTTEQTPPPASDQSEQPRDEHGRFASPQTGEDAGQPADGGPPPPQDAEPGHVPIAALKDERQKRQELERQLAEFQGYFTALNQQQQPQQQQPQAPDPNVDFAGWLNWRDQQIYAQIRSSIMQEVEQFGSQARTMTRAEVSEMQARQKFEDYDEVVTQSFVEAVQANPNLGTLLVNDPNPAAFAYNVGKKWEEAKALASQPAAMDELKAENERLRQQLAGIGVPQTPKAPSSLASERSVGSRSGPAWAGPTDWADILNQR